MVFLFISYYLAITQLIARTLKFFIYSSLTYQHNPHACAKMESWQLHMGHVFPWLPTEHVKIATPTKQFFSSVPAN